MVTRVGYLEEHDFEIAASIQRALLPVACPECEHGRIAAGHRMSMSVGGDFYDFAHAGSGKMGLLIGDVMGHGVSAALVMAMIVGLLRQDSEARADPVATARLINDRLREIGASVGHVILCSFFYGVFDIPKRTIEFVNAGHPPPVVCNRKTCLISGLSATCPVLGAASSALVESATHSFIDEDRITFYTDGITEAANVSGERFGLKRLHATAANNIDLPSHKLISTVFAEVDRFARGLPQVDDQSVVVLDFGGDT